MSQRPDHRTFRRHMALTASGVTLTFALTAALLLFVPLFAHLESGEFDRETLGAIAGYFLHLHASFWPVVLGAVVASVASGLVLFARMRSPLVRFVRAYDALAAGLRPAPVRLRSADYLHDEADALNRMLEALERRDTERLAEVGALEQELSELDAAALEPKCAAALAEARRRADRLRGSLSGRR